MKRYANGITAVVSVLLLLAPASLFAGIVSYEYDVLNRLERVTYPDGSIIAYTYDPAGNRTKKTVVAAAPPDRDRDGVPDDQDAFPDDPTEWEDTDGDGIGNNADPDDDNDGIADWADPDPIDDTVGLPPVRLADSAAQADHDWTPIDAASGFIDAVVIAGPPGFNDPDPGVVRLRNVGDLGFDLRFSEWDYLGDTEHAQEIIPYAVLKPGHHSMSDGSLWEIGSFVLEGTGAWQAVAFGESFAEAPHLFLTAQSANDADTVTVRARGLTAGGFEAALFEEEALMDGHGAERIGYLAIHSPTDGGILDLGGEEVPYELRRVVIDDLWGVVLANALKLEEEQSADTEIAHELEDLDVLRLGELLFAQDVSAVDVDTVAPRRHPVVDADHFLCYSAKKTRGSERFDPDPYNPVTLADQLETKDFELKKRERLCNPVDKNGEGILDEDTHLLSYSIREAKGEPKHERRTGIQVDNQFGRLFVDTLKPERLLVPAAKDESAPPAGPPDPEKHGVDHFKCYKVRVTRGTEKFRPLEVTLVDRFDQEKRFDVKKPTRLCTPVDKNGEGIKAPANRLMCYQIKRAKGEPKHKKVLGIYVDDQFGPGQLDTKGEDELCVPSVQDIAD